MLAEAIERKRVEEELRKSEKNLRLLTFRLFTLQETERKRVSQELHEGLAQTLVALQVGFIKGKSGQDQQYLYAEYEELRDLLKTTVENVRRLSQKLSPSILEDFGLFSALKYLIDNFVKIIILKSARLILMKKLTWFQPRLKLTFTELLKKLC